VGELEGKTKFGRPRHKRGAMKGDFKEIGLGGVDWADLVQDRDKKRALVWTAMNFRIPYNGEGGGSCCSFSRKNSAT